MVSYATLRGLGAPNKDIDGKDIEDEFSNMPVVQQYVARSWKELVTYRKVNTLFSSQSVILTLTKKKKIYNNR
jgi:hypothetical protein